MLAIEVGYQHRCPLCRAWLFHDRAPWHTLPYKFTISTAVVGMLSNVLKIAEEASRYKEVKRAYHGLRVLATALAILIQGWVLVQTYRYPDSSRLPWWRFWAESGFVHLSWPFMLWQLWKEGLRLDGLSESMR